MWPTVVKDSRQKAYEQFRIEFLDKLKSNIDEVKKQIKELNSALGEHRFAQLQSISKARV